MSCTPFTDHDVTMQRLGQLSRQHEIDALATQLEAARAVARREVERCSDVVAQVAAERAAEVEHNRQRAEAAEAALAIAVEALKECRELTSNPITRMHLDNALAKIKALKGGAT